MVGSTFRIMDVPRTQHNFFAFRITNHFDTPFIPNSLTIRSPPHTTVNSCFGRDMERFSQWKELKFVDDFTKEKCMYIRQFDESRHH
jgi:hypothetical protein